MRAKKIDANHPEIRKIFRDSGWYWHDTFQLPNFCDGIAVYKGVTVAIEVKDGSKPPSARKLTEGEQAFMEGWVTHGGNYEVIESAEDALSLILRVRGKINGEKT